MQNLLFPQAYRPPCLSWQNNTGVTSRESTRDTVTPPITAIAKGAMPKMVDNAVMRIGRKRRRPAWKIAFRSS